MSQHILNLEDEKDLILLDLLMPVMNGEEFIFHKKLNKNWTHIPIILMSACTRSGTNTERLGVEWCIQKVYPFKHDDEISAPHLH